MSKIRIKSIEIENYRSFGEKQSFKFPNENYDKPVAIVGYNNSGKTNLMNCILYGVGEKFISENTFEKTDLHNLKYENLLKISTNLEASDYKVWSDYSNKNVQKSIKGFHHVSLIIEDSEIKSKITPSFFGANKHYNIFYINFHEIKEEISTKKTNWGKLQSFLGKHIKKIVDSDESMKEKKGTFENEVETSTKKVLQDSSLEKFIKSIKDNYSHNLRDNNCEVEFGLPDYEDIFLQMMFKIGLNGDSKNLVPIDHFGDGYISMFVMAVIQAIAKTNTEDECLFLFEEPESFLHENHQEYFYKQVLCELSKKHQVIYTTHSDKMVDAFDTQGLIRLEMDKKNQTVKKYNNVEEFNQNITDEETGEIITIDKYNDYIRTIEPNFNKILFSKKVILVEGPNDVMVYKFIIKKHILEKIKDNDKIINKELYAETYLNFHNISIIPHHGKATAEYLIKICKWFKLDYFVINDWDFTNEELSLEDLQADNIYKNSEKKGMITTNWNLINKSKNEEGKVKIHFNIPKLETLLDCTDKNKKSIKIWEVLNNKDYTFNEKLFPQSLKEFLEKDNINNNNTPDIPSIQYESDIKPEDLPF